MDHAFFKTLHARAANGLVEPMARLCALVEYVRSVPYRMVTSIVDPYTGPCTMMEKNTGGTCSPKHYTLGRLLDLEAGWRTSSGLPELRFRYLTYPFKWPRKMVFKGISVTLNDDIPVEKLAEFQHAALEVFPGEKGRWFLVDITWDPELEKAGFPVCVPWDGLQDMPLSIPEPGEKFAADTVEKKLRHVHYLKTRAEHDPGSCKNDLEMEVWWCGALHWLSPLQRDVRRSP